MIRVDDWFGQGIFLFFCRCIRIPTLKLNLIIAKISNSAGNVQGDRGVNSIFINVWFGDLSFASDQASVL